MLRRLFKSVGTRTPKPRATGLFTAALSSCVGDRLHAHEENNVDHERWRGGAAEMVEQEKLISRLTLEDLLTSPDRYEQTCELFEDEVSRELFVQLVAFRLLGHERVRLPTNCSEHWAARERIGASAPREVSRPAGAGPLLGYDLEFEGERISVEGWSYTVTWAFALRQYYYDRGGVSVRPRKGERVIDAGAFLGETTLAFAASVGAQGRVAAFEIDPLNARLARRNFDLNPKLATRIGLHQCALAADRAPLYLSGSGPAARVSTEPTGDALQVDTIDGFVGNGGLDRVDFIKMDIEGAERHALAGAEKTLRRYRPSLAISIYHRPDDLWAIPLWLDELGIGYRFYLDHYTIHHEETVLYAIADR